MMATTRRELSGQLSSQFIGRQNRAAAAPSWAVRPAAVSRLARQLRLVLPFAFTGASCSIDAPRGLTRPPGLFRGQALFLCISTVLRIRPASRASAWLPAHLHPLPSFGPDPVSEQRRAHSILDASPGC